MNAEFCAVELPVIREALTLTWRHLNEFQVGIMSPVASTETNAVYEYLLTMIKLP